MPQLKKKKTKVERNERSTSVIREERKVLAKQIMQMRDLLKGEKTTFTEEEQAKWEETNKRFDTLGRELKVAKRADQAAETLEEIEDLGIGRGDFLPDSLRHLSKKGQRSASLSFAEREEQRTQDQNTALQAWLRAANGHRLKKRHIEACERMRFNPKSKSVDFRLNSGESFKRLQGPYQRYHHAQAGERARHELERRGYGTGLPDAGGVFVNPTFSQQVDLAMLDFSGVMQTSELITTSTGGEFKWPTGNDTSNKGRLLNAAGTATTDTTAPFASKSWYAYKFSSDLILVEQELLEDSVVDLPSIISGMLGERLGRIFNDYGTTGTGAETPEGIVTGASQGKETASQTAFTAKELIDMQHSVDPAYRNGAAWMMHDAILAEVRKLQDSENRFYINFIDGLREGVPDRLLGYPIFLNQSMDSTLAQSKKIMLFGQLNKYKVRRVNVIRMYRLAERYRETDQDGFVAFVRQDGKLLNAGVAPVKYLQCKTT